MANKYFNAAYYLQNNLDIMASGYTVANAESHYLQYGAFEAAAGAANRKPAPWFDVKYYLQYNEDLLKANLTAADAFHHFTTYGINEGRSPSAGVKLDATNLGAYAAANADLRTAFGITEGTPLTADQVNALANHFYQYGYSEARPGSPADVVVNPGQTFTLTAGADTFTGTAGNDVFNALTIDATGAAKGTFTGFDSIDGGAGDDTFNIYSDGVATINNAFPSNATVKNVETINVYNTGAGFGAIDASKFVGATAINQVGGSSNVSSLAATTTAGFNGVTLSTNANQLGVNTTATARTVTATDAATGVNVALTGAKGDAAAAGAVGADATTQGLNATVVNQAGLNVAGAALASVNVSGTLAQAVTTTGAAAASLALGVTAGKDIETLTLNSAVQTTLSVSRGAASTKDIKTVDASASTGGIVYAGAVTGATTAPTTIKTGSGKDDVTFTSVLDGTTNKAGLVSTGAGDDKVTINSASTGTGNVIAVQTGAGANTITVTNRGTATLAINAGEGKDVIDLDVALVTGDRIDGGAGTDDTVQLAAAKTALTTVDYALLRETISNVEILGFQGAVTAIDGDDLSQFSGLSFLTGANTGVVDIAATQSLTIAGATSLVATSKGYVASDNTATPIKAAQGGALTVVAENAADLTAKASVLNATLTLKNGADDATLTLNANSDVNTVNVTLKSSVDLTAGVATANNIAAFTFTPDASADSNATSITIGGNGKATVVNTAGKLATIDASGLTGVSFNGDILANTTAGLTYTGSASVVETITLGAASDKVIVASTFAKMDTIVNFDATKETADAKSTTDILTFGGVTFTKDAASNKKIAKVELTANDTLLSALEKAIAASNGDATTDGAAVFFNLSGDTYLVQDVKGATADVLDDNDAVVKLTGTIDFATGWEVAA